MPRKAQPRNPPPRLTPPLYALSPALALDAPPFAPLPRAAQHTLPHLLHLSGGPASGLASGAAFLALALATPEPPRAAALLLYDAVVAAPNATRRAQAEAVVDLWAALALTPSARPRRPPP